MDAAAFAVCAAGGHLEDLGDVGQAIVELTPARMQGATAIAIWPTPRRGDCRCAIGACNSARVKTRLNHLQ